jgi:hypothetical protein
MNELIELEKEEFIVVRSRLVKRIEILDRAKLNVNMSNDRIINIFLNYYSYKDIEPVYEDNDHGYFEDSLSVNLFEYEINFIFSYRSSTISIEKISLIKD